MLCHDVTLCYVRLRYALSCLQYELILSDALLTEDVHSHELFSLEGLHDHI